MESLREPNSNVQRPSKQEGFLLKRRKWPMKGWHKVNFLFLIYLISYGQSFLFLVSEGHRISSPLYILYILRPLKTVARDIIRI